MFFKLSALAALVPLVASLTLEAPENPTTQGTVTIKWTAEASDNVFSIELHHPSFNADLAIANNVSPADGSKTLLLPIVPVDSGYTLVAVNISNIGDVYSRSPSFSIGASTQTISSTSSGQASGTGSGSAAGTSSTSVLGVSQAPTTGFGVTRSNTANPSSSTGATSSGANGSGASPAPTGGAVKTGTTFGLLAAVAAVVAYAL